MDVNIDEIDTLKTTYEPEYALGTMLHDPIGGIWKYGKISFGFFPEGENCIHQWISWNGLARLAQLRQLNKVVPVGC